MIIEDSEQFFCGSDFLFVASHWLNQNYLRFIELVEDESFIILRWKTGKSSYCVYNPRQEEVVKKSRENIFVLEE